MSHNLDHTQSRDRIDTTSSEKDMQVDHNESQHAMNSMFANAAIATG